MSQEIFLSDNAGNRVPPDPYMADPVAASGATTSTGTAGTDLTLTVVAGLVYIVTCVGSAGLFSITGVTSTAANIEWVCPADSTILIKIPIGVTTLYFEGDTSTKNIYTRKMKNV